MKYVFADTSFFVAVIGPRDTSHQRAMEFARNFQGVVVTTEFVIVELGNYLFRLKDRTHFEPVVRNIQESANYQIIEANHALLERGIRRFALSAGATSGARRVRPPVMFDRTDKLWSLTDCISFVVMEEHGINDALTSDGDFEQAGFRSLLRE